MVLPLRVYGLLGALLAGVFAMPESNARSNPRGFDGPPGGIAADARLRDYRTVETQPGERVEVSHWEERGGKRFPYLRVETRFSPGRGGAEKRTVRLMLADRFLIEVTDQESPWLEPVLEALELESEGRVPFSSVFRVRLPDASIEAFEEMRERLGNLGALAGFRISPDYLAQSTVLPDDPDYGSEQDDLDLIGAPAAWDIATGSEDVVVAVIDSGIDFTHPDLAPNRFINPREIPDNGLDDDGNGLVDDISGWDFFEGDNDPSPENFHGTFMAGIIGAAGNNGIGLAGMTWQCQLLALRTGDDKLPWSAIIQAMDYVTAMRENGTPVTVVNNSYGGPIDDPLAVAVLSDAVSRAMEAGLLLVVAAGNEGLDNDSGTTAFYPSSLPHANILSVAATNNADELWGNSNFGEESVDLAAPGVGIYSTIPGDLYGTANGTSNSTARVSGLAALLLALNPDLSYSQLRQVLIGSADTVSELIGKLASPVRINAAAALLEGEVFPQIAWADGDGLLAVRKGEAVTLSALASDADGTVDSVEFFAEEALLGTDTDGSDGWTLFWDSPLDGVTLQLRITDSDGRVVSTFPRPFRSLVPFDYWRYEEWGDYFEIIPGSSREADPDRDGLVNLWEYAIRGSPQAGFTAAELNGRPRPVRFSSDTGTFFGFDLHLRSDDPDLELYLENGQDSLSPDSWIEQAPDFFEAPLDPLVPGVRAVRLGLAFPGQSDPTFLRLGVRFAGEP